jgi:hypothetical protein
MQQNNTPAPTPPPESSTPAPGNEPAISAHSRRPRRGKVARLPKAIRDQINVMMLDGVPYAEILSKLGDAVQGVTEHNVTSWANGGHQDWLREQQRLEETRVKQETAMDLACPEGGSKIHEGTLQLAATSLSEMVRNLDLSPFEELLSADPAKLIPFLNSLARLSDAELKCEQHHAAIQKRAAKLEKQRAPAKAPGLTPETRRAIEKDLNLM